MNINSRRVLFSGCLLCFPFVLLPGQRATEKDVWESLKNYLLSRFPAASAQYNVQFPAVAISAAWADNNRGIGSLRLEEVAGTIPPPGMLWRPTSNLVSERYGELLDALQFPTAPSVDGAQKALILSHYREKLDELKSVVLKVRMQMGLDRLNEYQTDDDRNAESLKALWTASSGRIQAVARDYEVAVRELDNIIAPNWPVRTALLTFRLARIEAANNRLNPGGFSYEGSSALLNMLIRSGEAADRARSCSSTWTFNENDTHQVSRTTVTSAEASWDSFVSIHGTRSTSRDLLGEQGCFITIGFCAQSYIPVRPGPWFSSSLLNLIQDGQLKIEASSGPVKMSLTGEDGWLPRLPVGIIVGFRPRIEAKVAKSYRKQILDAWNAGHEINFGPIRLAENRGGAKRIIAKESSNGSISLVAPGDDPYIVAVVSRRLP